MKIAIISDIHDNLVNLKKCLNWCKNNNIAKIICCGDITNSETLGVITQNFKKDIFLVKGNAEIYQNTEVDKCKNIKYLGKYGRIEIDKKQIGICHEPFFIDDVLSLGNCNIVFYGHTHKPWIEKTDGVQKINPGTLGGVFQRATFAVWDTEKDNLELKLLEILV